MTALLMTGCFGDDSASSSMGTASSSAAGSSSMTDSSIMDSSIIDSSDMSGTYDSSIPGGNLPDDSSMTADSSILPGDSDISGASSANSGDSEAASAAASASWELTLVNAGHTLPDDFTVETRKIAGYEKEFDVRAVEYLEAMMADAKAAGYPLHLVSAYRSVSYQKGLYQRKVQYYLDSGLGQAEAEAEAATWVARPGTSEHNLGLAADIVSGDWYVNHSDLTQDFEQTPQFEWLYEHCAEYGFVLRYPKGKETVTGVVYEPWHYRYVGQKAAAEMMKDGLSLEEYLS